MTFREFARDCCRQLSQWGYADETVQAYDRIYMQFLAYLKSQGRHDDLRSFTDATALGFAESLGARGIHPNTIIKALSALSTLARYGMMRHDERGRRLLSEDPTKAFRWPTAQRQETRFLSPPDLALLVDCPAPPHKAIARDILIETGIRVGEAARLNVDDFRQVEQRYYLAVKVKGRGQQARRETRQIPLSKALGEAIRDWLLQRGALEPDMPLLVNSQGKRWKRAVLGNMIARLADKAGVTMRVSPHKLRHTANVIARIAGVDAPTRSRLLGHSSLRSLERYDHILPHELHHAREQQLEAFQRYLGAFRATPEMGGPARKDQTEATAETVRHDEGMRDDG